MEPSAAMAPVVGKNGLRRWLRQSTAVPIAGLVICLITAVVLVCWGLHQQDEVVAAGTAATDASNAADAARSQGAAYASELRAAGYNSLSISSDCMVNAGHYQGDNFQDYQDGCAGIAMQVMQQGD